MTDLLTATGPTTLDRQALLDIVHGACMLGSGGGGPLTLGLEMVEKLTEPGAPPVQVAAPASVPDDARMAVSAAFGSPDAAGGASPDGLAAVAVGAYDALAASTGAAFTHVLPGEVGAGNSLIPMLVAQAKKLPLVDASGAPRAMPLLSNCVFADPAEGLPVSPIAFSNGQQTFGATAPSAELADPMLRGIVSAGDLFPEFGGIALWSMDGQQMKAHALAGTLTRARKLGEAVRTAPAGQKIAAACALLGGRVLYEGDHIQASEQTGGGFDVDTITLQAADGSSELVIYAQNENLIAWRSDQPKPLAMAPDLICYLTDDGDVFSNATGDIGAVAPGTRVSVIGVPAAPLDYASPWVVASFAKLLRQLGYAGPFIPLGLAT